MQKKLMEAGQNQDPCKQPVSKIFSSLLTVNMSIILGIHTSQKFLNFYKPNLTKCVSFCNLKSK